METSTIPVEDNPAPKSAGSLIQINSIYIDLKIPKEENQTESCQHNFSIRGYAAEMRMKNPKASSPFASDGNVTEERLPSLHVPAFKWWRCPACRRKIDNSSSTEEIKVHSNCCTNGLISSRTSLNVPSHDDTAMVLSGAQQVPTDQRSEGIRDVCTNAPRSLISVHDSQLSSGHQETNEAETGDTAATGNDTGPVEPVVDGASDIRNEERISQLGNITCGDKKGPTGQLNNNDGNKETPGEFQKSAYGGSAENPLDGQCNSVDAKQNGLMPSEAGDDTHIGIAPLQMEEFGNVSSESEQNKKQESSSGVLRRKRKLRYLTDLLGDKGNLRSELRREDDSSIHSKFVASSGSGAVVSQDQSAGEDIGKGTKSPQRKRKVPQEEPEGITDLGVVGTNDSVSKADSERTVTDNTICSSEGQANASSSVRKRIARKSDRAMRKAEKTTSLVKRKNTCTGKTDRCSPRPAEQLSSRNNIKEGDSCATAANTLLRSLGTSASGKIDNHSRNSRSPDREKSDVTQTALLISKLHPSPSKVGLDLSLNSFAEKIDSSVNKEKASTCKSLPEKNDLPVGQHSILPASEPDLSQEKSQVLDLNERIGSNSTDLPEKRNLSMLEDTSGHSEKTSEVEVCPTEINKDQIAGNRTASDDIPMEIVELMAKNQYERGLADAGNNSFQHRINNNMRKFPEVQGMGPTTQFTKYPGLTSFSSANARSGLAIRGANVGAPRGNPVNYPQKNRNHFEVIQPEKNKLSIFNMFPQNQHIFSRGMQFPASASAKTGPQHSERAEGLSSSTAPNVSFGLGIQQKYPAQNPEAQHRGKTISDIKADELKKTQDAHIILSKPGSSQLNSKTKGPVDPYANESIPAMQLLSLMNSSSPGNTFNMGSSKPFAPCVYHPRYSTTERRDFLSGSHFQRPNQLGTGTFSIGESSGRSSGQHPFAFSGQPQEQDQSYLARYGSCIPYTGQTSSQGKDKQKAIVGDSILYLQQHRGRRLLSLEDESIAEEVQPLRSIPPDEDNCVTNRNPAEFSLPDAGNVFTICGKDLKFPKKKYSRENMRDGAKRQRVAKPKAGREQPLQMVVHQLQ